MFSHATTSRAEKKLLFTMNSRPLQSTKIDNEILHARSSFSGATVKL